MKIYEYQAKNILKDYNIPVPAGAVVKGIEEGINICENIGFPLVIKAQVLTGGRGKAGAIRFVSSLRELQKELPEVFDMEVKGLKVKNILLEKMLDVKKQFYLAIIVEREQRSNLIMASSQGGVDIEEIASSHPDSIIKLLLSEPDKLEEKTIDKLWSFLEITSQQGGIFKNIVRGFFKVYKAIDAQLLEINPLVLTEQDNWFVCDAKIIIDDNALFRQPELTRLVQDIERNELEEKAHDKDLAYVKLKGNIGIIGNGAGLVMATMDEVKGMGGKPANFLDIGGGARKEAVKNALEIVYSDLQAEGIFINIFGGITRCDEVAKGVMECVGKMERKVPVVLRLVGTNMDEGRKILEESGLTSVDSMQEGACKIVELVRKNSR